MIRKSLKDKKNKYKIICNVSRNEGENYFSYPSRIIKHKSDIEINSSINFLIILYFIKKFDKKIVIYVVAL